MNKKYRIDGSITVFLSMTLLIIISLVMTTAEALRAYSMAVYTERALYTALDSVFAEFYHPLFKEYHVFGLDGGYGGSLIQEKIIEEKITDYMDHTFYPSNNISFGNFNVPIQSFNMFGINTNNVNIKDIKTFEDYNGDLFYTQGVDYTRYSLAAEGMDKLLEQFNLINEKELKDVVTTQEVLEKKMFVEEKVSLINDDIIALSNLLDGIIITNEGPKLNNEGNLYIKQSFVKKICSDNKIIYDPYPTNSWVSASLKGKYINPTSEINKSVSLLNSLIENGAIREKTEKTYKVKSKISLESIEDKDEKARIIQEIKEEKNIIKDCDKYEEGLISDFRNNIKVIKNLTSNTSSLIPNTIAIVNRLIINQNQLSDSIIEYKTFLLGRKDILEKDLYSSLWGDYLELEKYKGNYSGDKDFYNFIGMKNTLEDNQLILNKIQKIMDIKISSKKDTWENAKLSLNQANDILKKYSFEFLNLDYRSLSKKEEEADVFEGVNNIISDGIMELLLVDNVNISDKSIGEVEISRLPSYKYKNKKSLDTNYNISELNLTSSFNGFKEILASFTDSFNGEELLISSADSIGGSLLYQKYILDHFGSYQSERKVNIPTSLDYEVEYILQGKKSDSENLKSFVFNLFVFRTLMNSTSLFANSESNEQARLLAVSLVGFLGQPILVTIAKSIILFTWSIAESIVEISALLQEKSIALLKQTKDFEIDLKDLPFLNRRFIQAKVNKMSSSKSPQHLDYEDYLNIMLLFKNKNEKTFQALDLIQINLQNNYEDSFFISNCIYGISASADFSMEEKLVSLPFIQKTTGKANKKYLHSTNREYSY